MKALDIDIIQKINGVEAATGHLYRVIEPSERLQDALAFAHRAHAGQYRKSGEEYIVHPILVGSIVASLSGDETMVIAALLHDVIEDTSIDAQEINERYGEDVAHLVEGLTKIDQLRGHELLASSSNEKLIASALSFRKMLMASIEDVRVLVVKLCDRLHNMLTLSALPPHKQHRISEETLVVYAPIAHRLGISYIKNLLEDLSFRYLFPDEEVEINQFFKDHDHAIQERLAVFYDKLTKLMVENGFAPDEFTIMSRLKHHYSIHLKMQRKGISIAEILDLLAVRVIVKRKLDCYRVLGLVHSNFKPLSSRFKDYIAIPKENGYETLHTTVFDERAIFEVQIRTFEMHRVAEFGVAAHWKYKNGGNEAIKLDWLHEIQYQSESLEAFYELVKQDLYSEEISVFSPKGEAFTLPRGAVALDFAYAVHTAVGDSAQMCLINKEKSSLLTELGNGDMVQIITHPQHQKITRCTWIDSVKTSRAKHSMRANCNHRLRMLDSLAGVSLVATALRLNTSHVEELFAQTHWDEQAYRCVRDLDAFKEALHRCIEAMKQSLPFGGGVLWNRSRFRLKSYRFANLEILHNQGIGDVVFDYCCHPKIGDEIVSFLQEGKVHVHHKMCRHAVGMIENRESMLFIRWKHETYYHYHLIFSLQSTPGALAELLTYMAKKMQVDINSIELGKEKGVLTRYCEMEFQTLEDDIGKLRAILEKKGKIIEFVRTDDAYRS